MFNDEPEKLDLFKTNIFSKLFLIKWYVLKL